MRPSASIDCRYLLHFFKYEAARGGFARGSRSVGIHHLGRDALARWHVPLPPLDEQRRIAKILDLADDLRAKRRKAIAYVDGLVPAVFFEIFGDPIRNERSWARIDLGHLGQWHSGATPPRSKAHYFQGDVSWYSSGELGPLFTTESNERVSAAAFGETALKHVPAGALMLGMYDTAAFKSSIASEDCACNQAIAFSCIDPRVAETVYVYFAIQLASQRLRQLQRGIRQKNLNLSIVRQIQIPMPPTDLQKLFTERVGAIRTVALKAGSTGDRADALFTSIQSRAFAGEL